MRTCLHLAVLLVEVVGVVGGHQRDARLPGKPDELRQNLLLLGDAVVLNFDIDNALAKKRRCSSSAVSFAPS